MSLTAIVTMAAVLGFVWGGFLVILATAFKKERAKTRGATPDGA